MKYTNEPGFLFDFKVEGDIVITKELVDLIISEEPDMIVEANGKWYISDEDDLHLCEYINSGNRLANKLRNIGGSPSYNCKDADFYNVTYRSHIVRDKKHTEIITVTINHI